MNTYLHHEQSRYDFCFVHDDGVENGSVQGLVNWCVGDDINASPRRLCVQCLRCSMPNDLQSSLVSSFYHL